MKKVLYILFAACILAACENASEPIEDQSLKVTLSADTVWLTQNQLEENALTIKWTSGTNNGTGSAIHYTLLVTIGDTTAAWPMEKNGIRMLTLTHDQLNDSIHKIIDGREGLLANDYIDLTLQMQAFVVMTGEIQTSPVVQLAVATFEKQILYLVGSAAVNGWDKDKPTRILSDAEDAELFRWTGTLKKGEFKLLITQKDWLPCYVSNTEDETKMVLRTNDEIPDNCWKIKYDGNYTIECNTRDLTIAVRALSPAPDYGPELYIIGDAVPYGWNRDRAPIMAYEEIGGDTIFSWTGALKAGNFKFLLQTDKWDPCYVRDPQNSRHLLLRSGNGNDPEDLKWLIPHDGVYTITVHQHDLSLRIEQTGAEIGDPVYYQVWMIGSATPSGWSWDGIVELTGRADHDWNIISWTGELRQGEIKFPTEIQTDWSGEMIYAPQTDCPISENGAYVVHRGGEGEDHKWIIPADGQYCITINANNQHISFKQL